jgi:hypothetical protein
MLKHPVASNFLGRFGTMYKHASVESRYPLGSEPTKSPKPGRSYFDWWFKCPSLQGHLPNGSSQAVL